MENKHRLKYYTSLLVSVITLFFSTAFAQEVSMPATTTADSTSKLDPQFLFLFVLGIFIVVLLIVLYMLYALNLFLKNARQTGAMKEVPALLRFTDPVPIEREHEILLDHNYDGIRELDNKLPPWWVYLFYGTIVFAVIYIWFYHFSGNGSLQEQEYKQELAEAEIQMKLSASKVDENSVTLLTSADKIKNGEAIYTANCSPCHGKKGEGGVGPNLTDNYWLHGGGIKNVFKTVKYGVPVKGMIPWQTQLGPSQIQEVASYVITLKGTNPPNPKASQGELYKE
ncbi:MAG TPA: cbb3-type cytochrome c oxidase N-terminal domain-containing protein [Cytophagaceae bacterium]|jgi:cytochrome c oxidase cbb3-type subunit 3|nr:cbb3-type cytochrome c oxidase N-terminal domain-containing protein [Cytophagaceae bacterium]